MEKIDSENLLHRAFSVFLFNSKYELLLQVHVKVCISIGLKYELLTNRLGPWCCFGLFLGKLLSNEREVERIFLQFLAKNRGCTYRSKPVWCPRWLCVLLPPISIRVILIYQDLSLESIPTVSFDGSRLWPRRWQVLSTPSCTCICGAFLSPRYQPLHKKSGIRLSI